MQTPALHCGLHRFRGGQHWPTHGTNRGVRWLWGGGHRAAEEQIRLIFLWGLGGSVFEQSQANTSMGVSVFVPGSLNQPYQPQVKPQATFTAWPKLLRQETNTNRFVGRSFFQPFSCSSYVASSSTLQFICKNFSPMCMGRSSLVRTFFEFGRLKVRSFELTRRGGSSGKLPFWGGYLAFFGH